MKLIVVARKTKENKIRKENNNCHYHVGGTPHSQPGASLCVSFGSCTPMTLTRKND